MDTHQLETASISTCTTLTTSSTYSTASSPSSEKAFQTIRLANLSFNDDNTHEPSVKMVTAPQGGRTFTIRHKSSGRILILDNGIIRLLSDQEVSMKGGLYWACENMDGWFTFRNTVSGAYLGYACTTTRCGSEPQIVVRSGIAGSSEYFVAKYVPEAEGYILMVLVVDRHSPSETCLREMAVSGDFHLMMKSKGGSEAAAVWEFELV
ncbi:hypothetical protein F4778DRAFT_743814 [Xylariomycetidae sp. FL2044]|nr:hypothetical protein F4778DRAFT_743814 [Xylariomycetidae sp. FL2044]